MSNNGENMIRKMCLLALCFLFGQNFAAANEFDTGSPEFDPVTYPKYDEAEIQRKISQEMAVACSNNLCKIAGTDSHGSGWTVAFQVGIGQQSNSGSASSIYIGNNNGLNNRSPTASVTVTYKNSVCTSTLQVTPAVYRFVNTYLYNMVNTDGSVKKNFSPSDQTVILFYTTMLSKAESCGKI